MIALILSSTDVAKSSALIWINGFHVFRVEYLNFCFDFGYSLNSMFFEKYHIFSMGLISGLHAGHFIWGTLFSEGKCFTYNSCKKQQQQQLVITKQQGQALWFPNIIFKQLYFLRPTSVKVKPTFFNTSRKHRSKKLKKKNNSIFIHNILRQLYRKLFYFFQMNNGRNVCHYHNRNFVCIES